MPIPTTTQGLIQAYYDNNVVNTNTADGGGGTNWVNTAIQIGGAALDAYSQFNQAKANADTPTTRPMEVNITPLMPESKYANANFGSTAPSQSSWNFDISGGMDSKPKKDNTLLYFGIGMGVILLTAGIFAFIKIKN